MPTEKEIPPIIVKVNNLDIKRALVRGAKRTKLNGKDFDEKDYQIYIDEHLTAHKMKLLNEVKKQKYFGPFQYLWYQEGKEFVMEVEGQPNRRITLLRDLERKSSGKRNIDVRSTENDNPPSNSLIRRKTKATFGMEKPHKSKKSRGMGI